MPEFLSEPQRWLIPAVLLVALVGTPVALWWERRRPSVPEHVREMRAWRSLSAAEQEAADTAALDLAEQADLDAVDDAREAAEFLAHRAQDNALFHP
jgi:hypothetical protein